MRKLRVLQIIPRLWPEICGVGDYSLHLARELRDRHEIHTTFVIGDPSWSHGEQIEDFDVQAIPSRSGRALVSSAMRGNADMCILHYSGYGYQKRGAPTWLARGLRGLGTLPVCTMFHELFATGPLTSSAFWLSPIQRQIVRAIADRSRYMFTNRLSSQLWLERAVPSVRGRIAALPVFSNLGELSDGSANAARSPWLAVFGYQSAGDPEFFSQLSQTIENLGVELVISVGKKAPGIADACAGVPCIETGVVSRHEVSKWLSQAQFGFLWYDPDCLAKSGLLAAFLAHRLCVILANNRPASPLSDGLTLGEHLISVVQTANPPDFERVAVKGSEWYWRHGVQATASLYSEIVRHCCDVGCANRSMRERAKKR